MNRTEKLENLKDILRGMHRVVVAYSGGVDSTFLLKMAHDVLSDRVFAVLAVSPTFPSREYNQALETAEQIGVRVKVVKTNELDNIRFKNNPVNRCYFCKSELFGVIAKLSETQKFTNMVDGSNFDDKDDYRPGMKALKEKNVRSPLREAKLTKKEIRYFSKKFGLSTWEKDELACLSSRFPYGVTIDEVKLKKVDRVENALSDFGFKNIRARHNGNTVKIEVEPYQIQLFSDPAFREKIVRKIKNIGYTYVTLDLEGYRRGSMNEVLSEKNK